jgi:hypothetical protein
MTGATELKILADAKPKCRAWACDATKIHAHARSKPICVEASHFCEPKS